MRLTGLELEHCVGGEVERGIVIAAPLHMLALPPHVALLAARHSMARAWDGAQPASKGRYGAGVGPLAANYCSRKGDISKSHACDWAFWQPLDHRLQAPFLEHDIKGDVP